MKLNIVTVSPKPLFHVGTMNVSDKGSRGSSYEGRGLSVSTEPDAWVVIAQLGGLPTHKVSKKGAKFLDFYALVSKKNNKQTLYQWGKQNGHITLGDVWEVKKEDDEWETTFVSYTQDEAEAAEEEESGAEVKKVKNFPIPTDAAMEKAGLHKGDRLTSVHECLALLVAEEVGLDGVWWDDDLDEDRMSAPRGVIFPEKLPTWKICQMA